MPNVTLDLNGFSLSCNACTSAVSDGIVIQASAVTVLNGTAAGFTGTGAAALPARATILHSTFSNNGVLGIYIGGGLVSANQIIGNGNTPHPGHFTAQPCGIDVNGSVSITNNMISNNAVGIISGLSVANPAVIGFGLNTFAGNGQDVSGKRLVSMNNNASGTGVF